MDVIHSGVTITYCKPANEMLCRLIPSPPEEIWGGNISRRRATRRNRLDDPPYGWDAFAKLSGWPFVVN